MRSTIDVVMEMGLWYDGHNGGIRGNKDRGTGGWVRGMITLALVEGLRLDFTWDCIAFMEELWGHQHG
jgi:hypothetical protein